MARYSGDKPPLEKKKDPACRTRAQDLQRSYRQQAPGKSRIKCTADNYRNADVEKHSRDDADDANNQRSAVRPKVPQKLAQIIHEPEDI